MTSFTFKCLRNKWTVPQKERKNRRSFVSGGELHTQLKGTQQALFLDHRKVHDQVIKFERSGTELRDMSYSWIGQHVPDVSLLYLSEIGYGVSNKSGGHWRFCKKKGMPHCNLKEKCWLDFRTYIFLFKFVNFSECLLLQAIVTMLSHQRHEIL